MAVVRLGERQYRALLDLVGEVNGARDLDEMRRSALSGVRRMVPCDVASYNEVTRDGRPLCAITEPEVPPWAHAAWSRLAHTNPLVRRYALTRDGRPYRFSDVVAAHEFELTPLYRELYEPLGIRHQMAIALPSPSDLTIGLVLSRGDGDFTDAERELLALARPHLIQAHRNAQALAGEAVHTPTPARLRRLGLSPAEALVLAALAAGRSTAETATDLGLSPRTVLKHGERINRKLGVRDRAQAVAAAWRTAQGKET